MPTLEGYSPEPNLASQLRLIIRGRTTLDLAQFQYIGLGRASRPLNHMSPAAMDQLWSEAEAVIRPHLHAADILVRIADGVLIVFADRQDAEAETVAQQVADALNDKLVRWLHGPDTRFAAVTRPMSVPQLARALGVSRPAVRPAPAPTPAEVEWLYQPVWDVWRETVTSCFLAPWRKGANHPVRGYQFEQFEGPRPGCAELDEASLDISELALRRRAGRDMHVKIGVALHVNTLLDPVTGPRMFAKLGRLDRALARDRIIKLAGVEPGFPTTLLANTIGRLRERVPLVVVTAAWDEPDVPALIAARPSAIGFAYPDALAGALAVIAEGTLLARFHAGVDAAHAAGLPLYVEGQIGPYLARAFTRAGADYIASPHIWRPRATPDAGRSWPARDLPVH